MSMYEPFYEVFDRFFDEGSHGPRWNPRRHLTSGETDEGFPTATRSFRPKMDLHEDLEKNVVTATLELPGFKKDQIKIDV